jgi:SAM-dependent methyltransferase
LSSFFGELYLRSTLPFLSAERTERDVAYLARAFETRTRLLDIGCGHGRHASRLAERGFPVVGVDFDPLALAQREPGFVAVRADFRSLPFRGGFDGAYAWYSTLFIGTDAENERALRAVAACLRPGGLLLAQTVPFEWFERNPRAVYDGPLPDGSHLREENVFDRASQRDRGTRHLRLPDGRVLSGSYAIRAYRISELEALGSACGFRWAWAHGDVDGNPLEKSSRELIVGLTRK